MHAPREVIDGEALRRVGQIVVVHPVRVQRRVWIISIQRISRGLRSRESAVCGHAAQRVRAVVRVAYRVPVDILEMLRGSLSEEHECRDQASSKHAR